MKFLKSENNYIVKIDRGEDVMQTLLRFIKKENIKSGSISGLGAIENIEIGYFNKPTKEYFKTNLDGIWELISFSANIAWSDEEPIVHSHIALSDKECNMKAGHFYKGECAVTVELFITTTPLDIQRKLDPEVNLKLLDI